MDERRSHKEQDSYFRNNAERTAKIREYFSRMKIGESVKFAYADDSVGFGTIHEIKYDCVVLETRASRVYRTFRYDKIR